MNFWCSAVEGRRRTGAIVAAKLSRLAVPPYDVSDLRRGTGCMSTGKTLFDKVWDLHVVARLGDGYDLLHVDRQLIHDLSGTRALQRLGRAGPWGARSGPELRHPRPHRLDRARRRRRRAVRRALRDAAARAEPRPWHPPVRRASRGSWHRPRDRPGAGPDLARRHLGLRRQPYLHPWGAWARSPGASGRARWRTCWPPRPWSSASRNGCASASTARYSLGSRRRT